MIVLVANLGSTSFKYKLFDFSKGEAVLARGSADRIGVPPSAWSVEANGQKREGSFDLADHGAAIELHLKELVALGAIETIDDVEAIGFKAVHGGPISGAVRVDDEVLATMERFSDVAPAHNPPYIAAMKAFAKRLPGVPQVAAFETGYHQGIPLKRQAYAIPYEWTEKLGVRRYGFHGASHRYIATRMAQIAPGCKKIVSCHLGGSCSINAIENGESVANSFGMTAQSGVPHASRVGDFDAFALLKLLKAGVDLETIWKRLGKEGGLLGVSGVSSDLRDVQKAAAEGDKRAKLAVEIFVESVRQYVGAFLAVLGGADAVCFTGGIGQHNKPIRSAVLAGFEYAGIALDLKANDEADGNAETRIDAAYPGRHKSFRLTHDDRKHKSLRLTRECDTQIWVLPTDEELIVARQTVAVLKDKFQVPSSKFQVENLKPMKLET